MDFPKGSDSTLKKMARAFDIPWSVISTDKVNLANANSGDRRWKESGIRPRMIRIEQKLNERLIPMYPDETIFCAFDNPVPEDEKFKLEKNKVYLEQDVKTINEVRQEEGLDPVPWGDKPAAKPQEQTQNINDKSVVSCNHRRKEMPPPLQITNMEDATSKWLDKSVSLIEQSVTEASVMTPEGIETTVDWFAITGSGVAMMRDSFQPIFLAGVGVGSQRVPISFDFDMRSPEAVAWTDKYVGDRITLINNETKLAIRDTVGGYLRNGMNPQQLARSIRPHIGLNAGQSTALIKLRTTLEGRGLPAGEVDSLVAKESAKKLRYRAALIARTETAAAYVEGELQVYRESGMKMVEWNAVDDSCPECTILDGKRFTIGDAKGRQPLHPNCRCDFLPVLDDQ